MCFASKMIQFTIANMKMIIYRTVNGHQFSSVLPLIILLIIYYFVVCFTILHKRLSMVKAMKIGDHLQWCKWSFSYLLWWIGSFCLQNTWNEIFQNITSFFILHKRLYFTTVNTKSVVLTTVNTYCFSKVLPLIIVYLQIVHFLSVLRL